jgi:hypothetical protein
MVVLILIHYVLLQHYAAIDGIEIGVIPTRVDIKPLLETRVFNTCRYLSKYTELEDITVINGHKICS